MDKKNKSKRIEFDLPEGFTLPDQISTNSEFDTLATIKLKDDGSACLVALDGYRMPGYQAEDGKEEAEPKQKSYADAASEGMAEGY